MRELSVIELTLFYARQELAEVWRDLAMGRSTERTALALALADRMIGRAIELAADDTKERDTEHGERQGYDFRH